MMGEEIVNEEFVKKMLKLTKKYKLVPGYSFKSCPPKIYFKKNIKDDYFYLVLDNVDDLHIKGVDIGLDIRIGTTLPDKEINNYLDTDVLTFVKEKSKEETYAFVLNLFMKVGEEEKRNEVLTNTDKFMAEFEKLLASIKVRDIPFNVYETVPDNYYWRDGYGDILRTSRMMGSEEA